MTAAPAAHAWMRQRITAAEYDSWSDEQRADIEIVGADSHTNPATELSTEAGESATTQ